MLVRFLAAAALILALLSGKAGGDSMLPNPVNRARTLDSLACKATRIVVAEVFISRLGMRGPVGSVWRQVDIRVTNNVTRRSGDDTPDTLGSFAMGGWITLPDGQKVYQVVSDSGDPFREVHFQGQRCLLLLRPWPEADSLATRHPAFRPTRLFPIIGIAGIDSLMGVPVWNGSQVVDSTLSLEDCIARIRAARAAAGLR